MSEKDFEKENSELNKVMAEISKKYGEGIMSIASKAKALNYSRLRTGSFSLDVETGGGLPENRIITLAGPYEAGKSTLSLKVAKQAQKKYPHRKVLWIDSEGAFDLAWASKQDVDLDQLIIVKPEYAEQAFDIVDNMVRQPNICLVVVDSITALLPAREMEESMEEWQIGLNAYLNAKFLKKITSSLWQKKSLSSEETNRCTVLLLNQLRDKIGGYGYVKDTMPGGRAIGHYSSVIIYVRPGEWLKEKIRGREEIVGQIIKFNIEKNRTYPPKKKGSFDFYTQNTSQFKAGQINRVKEVLTYGVIWDIIVRKGAWYYFGDEKFQGGTALLEYLQNNESIIEELEQKILEKVSSGNIIEEEIMVDPDGIAITPDAL